MDKNENIVKSMASSEDKERFPNDSPGLEVGSDQDNIDLAMFGKLPQLKRQFGFFSMVGLTCTLMATWEGLFSVFTFGFTNGGPAGLVITFIIGWIGTIGMFCSLAEMASAVPLAGGQYSFVSEYAPPRVSNFLSYITGWLTCLGWPAATASSAYLGGTMIQGLIKLNNPDYVLHSWHGTLLFYALILLALIFNTYLVKLLPKIEGADSACHMAVEIQNAANIVPRTMVATTILNGVLGFAALIAILFCAGDIETAQQTPTGYPFIEIFYQATNSVGGATAMVCVILIFGFFATIGLIATASRMTWAFARDNGLPGSRWLAKVEPRSALPLNSIAVTVVISLLLALINIGSSTAFNAIVSLSVISVLASYMVPIVLLLRLRLLKEPIRFGPWKLGRWGMLANIIGLAYATFAFFFSFWPETAEVTVVNMNWACLVWGFAMLFCTLWYGLRAHKYYTGPVRETD